ncbi:MAG: hypothetical protein KBC06_02580 [Candidatus Pacebacteria bacterium]|nr:hypothetical protein [Candidatus Paceibacterota bacterium]
MDRDAKKILKTASLSIFFLFIIVYAGFRSYDLVVGVKIKNVNIVDGATMTQSELKITGRAKNALNLTLNGREISVDQSGNFSETIALLSGYNIVSLKALDKFGHSDEKDFHLIGGFAEEAKLQVTN